MKVCLSCRKELRCVRTGMDIAFDEFGHCYRADVFRCPQCGTEAAFGSTNPYHNPKYRAGGAFVEMWPEGEIRGF